MVYILVTIYIIMFDLGYEPAGLTVHLPSPQNDRGWVYFFRMGLVLI